MTGDLMAGHLDACLPGADAGATVSRSVDSPVGRLELVARDRALVGIRFGGRPVTQPSVVTPRLGSAAPARPSEPAAEVLAEAHRQLAEYFAGERQVFDLPLRPTGTPFQHRVWDVLATVPWGSTTTYGALAARLGMPPGAARAVGAANGANPLPVVLPCHRVIGSDGSLTGYAGGLERKAALLRLEHVPFGGSQPSLF